MDVWISRGCPHRKFFINKEYSEKHQRYASGITWNVVSCRVWDSHHFFFTLSISFYFLFFPSHLNCLSQTWSGVSQDMSNDQRLSVCGWFILNEKTLWSGLRAASNARHLQIIMIKHSNGTYSYPQTSHSLRGLYMHICRICWNGGLGVYNWCEYVIRPNLWKWTAVAEIN